MECMYGHLSECDSPLRWRIVRYFSDGRDAEFCDKHAGEFRSLHPFGPDVELSGVALKKASRKKESA